MFVEADNDKTAVILIDPCKIFSLTPSQIRIFTLMSYPLNFLVQLECLQKLDTI